MTDDRQGLFGPPIILDQTNDKAREIDPARDQRPQTRKDRDVSFKKLEPAAALYHDRVRFLELDQGRQHFVEQVLAMEDGDQKSHSVPFQSLESLDK